MQNFVQSQISKLMRKCFFSKKSGKKFCRAIFHSTFSSARLGIRQTRPQILQYWSWMICFTIQFLSIHASSMLAWAAWRSWFRSIESSAGSNQSWMFWSRFRNFSCREFTREKAPLNRFYSVDLRWIERAEMPMVEWKIRSTKLYINGSLTGMIRHVESGTFIAAYKDYTYWATWRNRNTI